MRCALLFALLAACSSTGLPNGGGDGAQSSDLSVRPGADLAHGPADLANLSCAPTCNRCIGVCCPGAPNGGCCAAGEWCDNGTCHCGSGPACTSGQSCSSGGPINPANDCGSICCGDPGHPCPL